MRVADEILERIVSGEMPPGDAEKLTPDEIELVRAWIVAGMPAKESADGPVSMVTAEDREFWSFQPVERNIGRFDRLAGQATRGFQRNRLPCKQAGQTFANIQPCLGQADPNGAPVRA